MEKGWPKPGRNVCVTDGRAEAEPTYDSQSPGVTSKHQMLNTEIFYSVGFELCYDLIITGPWFVPLSVGKFVACFQFYRSTQLRGLGLKKKYIELLKTLKF